MGNKQSNTKDSDDKLKPKSVFKTLDYIATYYILTMDFQSLHRLYEKQYCDNLILITSDIIDKYFTNNLFS